MWNSKQAQLHSLVGCQPLGVTYALKHIKEHVARDSNNPTPSSDDVERMKKYALWVDCLTTIILQDRKDTEERKKVFKGLLYDINEMLQRI